MNKEKLYQDKLAKGRRVRKNEQRDVLPRKSGKEK